MSLRELQDYTFVSKYARYNEKLKRRETWDEAVDRVKDMHLQKYPKNDIKEDIEWAFDRVKEKRVLGSQRALQFGGKPVLKKNARLYNCTVSFCDRLRFFQESFWLLLCGCGVGFSVQKHHVAKLPDFTERKGKTKTYVIPDSIEGWSDSLGVLLSSYFGGGDFAEYGGYDVEFNFGLIRPEGSKLGSSSGKAPGPVPLQNALQKIVELLDDCLLEGRQNLRTIDAYDIVMHTSDAVLSGGVRRSATICLFSPDDQDMATAKTGNWFNENPQRGRSNNSALLIRGKTTYEQFATLMESVKEYGEPGFVWSDSTELMVNPCVTKKSLINTTQGLKTVEELIGKKFDALVDGKSYTSKGFWKTGDKQTLILEFKSGRTLEVTPNHRVMTTNGWKEAKEISLNDEIVINNHREADFDIDVGSKDHAQGYLLGSFLGDGNISKKSAQIKWWGKDKDECRLDGFNLMKKADFTSYNYKEESESVAVYSTIESVKLYRLAESLGCVVKNNRRLNYRALSGNWSNLTGLIAGYFDADGTVSVDFKKGCSVRFCSKQMNNLKNLQIALNALGIYGKIYKNRRDAGMRMLPDGQGESKEFYCEAVHELSISCDNIIRFQKLIPIRNKDKANKINEIVNGYKRLPNRTNFVDVLVNKTIGETQDVYDCTVEDIHAFDCDGIYVHNCVEIGMWPVCAVTGESGWSFCNLCEINGKKVKTPEDFEIAVKAAAIIGTLQAGYDQFDYLGDATSRIVKKEALLGVSITGMQDSPEILFNPKLQRKMAKLVLKVNELIAAKIGINVCARGTCVKPAGTTSCVLGTASGIHPHHARRYIRRSQANYLEAPCRHFKETNPNAVEKSVWSANGTDEVIAFCVEVPKCAKVKNDLDAITLLEHVKLTQQNWVTAGTREEACAQPWLKHNVSNTITVMDGEWEQVTKYIFKNRKHFAGISLLPQSGDKDYPQAPFTAIYTPTELAKMYGDGMPMASGLVVDGLHEFNNNLWVACDEAIGVTDLPEPKMVNLFASDASNSFLHEKNLVDWTNKKDWCRRVQQFADRYLEGDIRQATYLMKDVHNWKLWCDLNREYKNVDYTLLFEDTDETKLMQESGCAGGSCTVEYA